MLWLTFRPKYPQIESLHPDYNDERNYIRSNFIIAVKFMGWFTTWIDGQAWISWEIVCSFKWKHILRNPESGLNFKVRAFLLKMSQLTEI